MDLSHLRGSTLNLSATQGAGAGALLALRRLMAGVNRKEDKEYWCPVLVLQDDQTLDCSYL